MLWNRIYKIKNSIDVYLVDEEYVLFYFMNTRARKRFRVNETVIKLIEEIDGDNAKLRLYVDIVKGDYKGWFKRIYEKRGEWSFNAIFTRYIVKDGVIKKSFQDLIKDLEKSNPQFTFDFKELDAAQFKNLFCGFTFGEEEYLDKNNFTRTSVSILAFS